MTDFQSSSEQLEKTSFPAGQLADAGGHDGFIHRVDFDAGSERCGQGEGEFAAEVGRQTGRTIPYVNLPEADYRGALLGAGLPEPLAHLLADSDVGASKGGLFDDGHRLSALIGRPTTALLAMVEAALR